MPPAPPTATLVNGGTQDIAGTANGATVAGGVQYDHGTATATTVGAAAQHVLQGSSAAGTRLRPAAQDVVNGTVTDTVPDGDQQVLGGGVAVHTAVVPGLGASAPRRPPLSSMPAASNVVLAPATRREH